MNKSKNSFSEHQSKEDTSVVLRINRLNSAGAEQLQSNRRPLPSATVPLSKSASKSEDSLDSGVYTRQKSVDSMDSLESNDGSLNGEQSAMNRGGLSPSEEALPSMPSQYEDYLRECQDIRQSIIVVPDDDKQSVSRTDSGDDQDDDNEADWLRLAGLSDLVVNAPNTQTGQSKVSSRISTESLSSMTVLSTLTRPQREAVLRRITSFNRAQKSRKRPKPAISAIFPTCDIESPKSPQTPSPTFPPGDLKVSDDVNTKSSSLPRDVTGFGEGGYPRRYSETPRRVKDVDSPIRNLPLSPTESKSDYRFKHKKSVESIVATETSGGIETLSIHPKRLDDSRQWTSGRETANLQDDVVKDDKSMSYSGTADQANLPNFSLVKDRLGITTISDLSQVDMRKVQSLALIELTALFDLRGIDLKRKKPPKNKVKELGVFGVSLSTLVEWDQKRLNNPSIRVPLLLREIISFLEENALQDEGILRKSGSSARIKSLKQNMELRYGFSNTASDAVPPPQAQMWAEAHPNDVAAILKQFLRELPDPLLTSEYIEAFQSCGLISDRKEQLQALNLLIILLNQVHRDSLKLLLKFLEHVVSFEKVNKMSLNNVAMITAPNLFMGRKQSKKESSSTSQDLKHAAGTSNIVRMLIKYNKLLWTVPAFMLTQVRHMNRAESSSKKVSNQKEKHKIKFFPVKTKDPNKKLNLSITHQPFDIETPKGVIRVQAPDMIMTSMAVQMDAALTAGDVIARFQRQCERINPSIEINNSTHALFEVGGNINERCLHPETNMSALMRVNPDTSWFIKPRT
uniref:Rho GTPase-activating protein 18 n=1 Tax=Phallusia mammillata TaxID=59560 RepID=A0A6F9D7F2_9ASCI|nr:rho GTPase-activating protein 18 [Phallusia mammillata]